MRLKLIPQRIYVKLCKLCSLFVFLRRMFSKALWRSGRGPLLRFDGISCGSLKM